MLLRRLLALTLPCTGLVLVGGPPAHAASCGHVWTGAVSNVFDDAGNWSSAGGGVPATTDSACVTKAGTYTLTFAGNRTIDSIVLGSDTAHVTLDVTSGAILNAGTSLAIAAGSGLHLSATTAAVSIGGNGTFTNAGTISSDDATSAPSSITLAGTSTGTISVLSGQLNIMRTLLNQGTLASAPGATMLLTFTGTVTNAGTITNAGTVNVQGRPFVQQGTTTGNPVIVGGSSFTDVSGTGSFALSNSVHLTGTIPAGQVVHVGGGAGPDHVLIADSPVSIAPGGTLAMELPDSNGWELQGSITNHGTISLTATQPTFRGLVSGQLVNTADGTIAVHSGALWTLLDGTITNHGLLSVDPGATVAMGGHGPGLDNAADGTLRFGLASATSFGTVSNAGAPMGTVAGHLDAALVGGYVPTPGTSLPVIGVAHGAGTFATVTPGFTAAYTPASVSLVVPLPRATTVKTSVTSISSTGVETIKLTAGSAAKVTLVIRSGTKVLLTKTATLKAHRTSKVTLTLSKKSRAWIAAHPKSSVTLTTTVSQPGHTSVTSKRTLKHPKRFS